jgi:hypothetical protein
MSRPRHFGSGQSAQPDLLGITVPPTKERQSTRGRSTTKERTTKERWLHNSTWHPPGPAGPSRYIRPTDVDTPRTSQTPNEAPYASRVVSMRRATNAFGESVTCNGWHRARSSIGAAGHTTCQFSIVWGDAYCPNTTNQCPNHLSSPLKPHLDRARNA